MVTYNPNPPWANGSAGNTPITADKLQKYDDFLALIAPLIGSGGGNTLTAIEQSAGVYAVNGSTVTTRQSGYFYVFYGLNQPPFQAAGDTWIKIDLGYAIRLVLKSQDDFNDGANTSPATAAALKTKWVGDTAYFNQSSSGVIQGTGWETTATDYIVMDSTKLAAAQAVELVLTSFSSNTTKTAFKIFLNSPTSAGVAKANVTGYRLSATIPSTGDRYWQLHRFSSGTATQIGSNVVDATITNGIGIRFEHDGAGSFKVTSGNNVVATWTDGGTPLTGTYAGLSGTNPGGSGTSSAQGIKADNWKAYSS